VHDAGACLSDGLAESPPRTTFDGSLDSYVRIEVRWIRRSPFGTFYQGTLPLVRTNRQLSGLEFDTMGSVLADLVRWCMAHGQVRGYPLILSYSA
jgi:hypothetical protein